MHAHILTEINTYPWPLMLKLKQPNRSQPRESAPHYNVERQWFNSDLHCNGVLSVDLVSANTNIMNDS